MSTTNNSTCSFLTRIIEQLLSGVQRASICFLYTLCSLISFFFFLNDTATPEFYPLPLPDALPICPPPWSPRSLRIAKTWRRSAGCPRRRRRSRQTLAAASVAAPPCRHYSKTYRLPARGLTISPQIGRVHV